MPQDSVGVVRELYDAFGAGDVEAALARMDPSIEWNEAGNLPYADGNPYVGPQAVLEGALGTYTGTYSATGRGVYGLGSPACGAWRTGRW